MNEAEQLPGPFPNHFWSQLTWINFQTIFNISNKISSNQCFIEFLLTNFRKVSKFGVLCSPFLPLNFSEFLKNFLKNFQLFQNRKKTIVFVTKLVQNDYIDQHSVKFSHKSPKNVQFLLKTLNFSKFSAPKIWSFMSQKFGIYYNYPD